MKLKLKIILPTLIIAFGGVAGAAALKHKAAELDRVVQADLSRQGDLDASFTLAIGAYEAGQNHRQQRRVSSGLQRDAEIRTWDAILEESLAELESQTNASEVRAALEEVRVVVAAVPALAPASPAQRQEIDSAWGDLDAALRGEIDQERVNATARFRSLLDGLSAAVLVGSLLATAIAVGVAASVAGPITRLSRYADAITRGEPAEPPDLRARKDEISALSFAVADMVAANRQQREDVERLAFRDDGTGLLNRRGLVRDIEAAKACLTKAVGASTSDEGARSCFVAVLSFRRLRWIQNALDDEAALEMARLIAARLGRIVDDAISSGDAAGLREKVSLARIGFGHFAIYACVSDAKRERRLLRRIRTAFDEPIGLRDMSLNMAPSIGVAYATVEADDPAQLIGNAWIAAPVENQAEDYRVFSPELRDAAISANAMRVRIAKAIEAFGDGGPSFEPFFQPQICSATGKIVGAEALARWRQPDGALAAPGAFLPVAEESGQIIRIDDIIMRQALDAAMRWRARGLELRVSCNASSLGFLEAGFSERVLWRLQQSGLPPHLLTVEITETVAVADADRTREILAPLKDVGVQIALDDFGAGHSNLSALHQLPIDCLKLDRSLAPQNETQRRSIALLDAVVLIGHSLGMTIVAEGVETPWQLEILHGRGCQTTQGFLHSKPLPEDAFIALVENWSTDAAKAS